RVAPQGAGRGHRTSGRVLGSAEGETATRRTRDQAGDRSAELLVHAPIRARGAGRPALHLRRRQGHPPRRGGDLPLGDRPPRAPQALDESRLTSGHNDSERQCICIDITMQMHYSCPETRRRRSTMPATLEAESTLTDRYQTTVPETVRRALRLGKRDKIRYTVRSSGEVVLTRAEVSESEDPLLAQFLGFLARDIASHPERLQAVDAGLVQRLQSLVGGVEVDLDAALSADYE